MTTEGIQVTQLPLVVAEKPTPPPSVSLRGMCHKVLATTMFSAIFATVQLNGVIDNH